MRRGRFIADDQIALPVACGGPDRARLKKHNAWFTPQGSTLYVMRSLRDDFGINPWRWKDPQAGAGVWGWAGKQVWPAAVSSAVEVRAEEAEHIPFNYDTFWIEDYLEAPLRVDSEDLIATNPSFEDAMPVADKALRELRDGGHLVLLLRLTWGDNAEVSAWLREHPPVGCIELDGRLQFAVGINPLDPTLPRGQTLFGKQPPQRMRSGCSERGARLRQQSCPSQFWASPLLAGDRQAVRRGQRHLPRDHLATRRGPTQQPRRHRLRALHQDAQAPRHGPHLDARSRPTGATWHRVPVPRDSMTQPRTRSLRPSLVTPAIVQHGLTAQAAPRSPSAVMAQAARAEGIITEQIVVVRRAVAEHTDANLPGSDAELEDVVIAADMIAHARETYERPRGHLTSRLTRPARDRRASTKDEVIKVRLARRPFATVQARVIEVLKAGRLLDTLALSGPDVGLAVRLEVGPGFPWDVLV